MVDIFKEVAYSVRRLRGDIGFTVAATLTLALGIAVPATTYATVRALLAVFLPHASLDGVDAIVVTDRKTGEMTAEMPAAVFRRFETSPTAGVLAAAAVRDDEYVTIAAPGHSEQVRSEVVTAGYSTVT